MDKLRFLKERSNTRTTIYHLAATGRCIHVFKGIIFINGLVEEENVRKFGLENTVERLKIKYRMDEVGIENVPEEALVMIKDKYQSHFKDEEEKTNDSSSGEETSIKPRSYKNKICAKEGCNNEFEVDHPRRVYCVEHRPKSRNR